MGFIRTPETEVKILEVPTANLPQTTQTSVLSVSGKVLLTQIVGEVTTIIQAQATNLKIVSNPSTGADVDLCAVVDINADAVGTLYTLTGTLADAMVATTSAATQAEPNWIVCSDGYIDFSTDASSTGQVKWTLQYIPLENEAKISIVQD